MKIVVRMLHGFVRCVGVAWLTYVSAASANTLDEIAPNWRDANLRVSLDSREGPQVEQGSNFGLRIGADQDASVLIVVVNSEGRAEMFRPQRPETADRVSPGTDLLFPDALSGETLYANMPVGRAYVYVLASPDSLLSNESNIADWVPEARVGQKLADALHGADPGKIALRRLQIEVKAPTVQQFISKDEFIAFYDPHGLRTRGLCNASRGLAVQFATNSAELTDWGRRQLNEIATGMRDEKLSALSFLIEGHTDDRGTDEYNVDLSGRRAQRVRLFLADRGVQEGRLERKAMGKADPAMPGQSDEARAKNRRVVIKRLDQTADCK